MKIRIGQKIKLKPFKQYLKEQNRSTEECYIGFDGLHKYFENSIFIVKDLLDNHNNRVKIQINSNEFRCAFLNRFEPCELIPLPNKLFEL